MTIAGQTSPGGICIADYQFWINSNDVIIRFLRFRPGDMSGGEPDGLGGMDKKNIIIDHCSTSWSVDECLSVYGMENSTVQWCLAGLALHNSTHGKGSHGYGGNWGGNHASYHHNMIAHCKSRVPRLGPRHTTQENEYVDIRNNVFYNWSGEGCYGGENQNINIVNNFTNRDRLLILKQLVNGHVTALLRLECVLKNIAKMMMEIGINGNLLSISGEHFTLMEIR